MKRVDTDTVDPGDFQKYTNTNRRSPFSHFDIDDCGLKSGPASARLKTRLLSHEFSLRII